MRGVQATRHSSVKNNESDDRGVSGGNMDLSSGGIYCLTAVEIRSDTISCSCSCS